jgi:hypothetical protein
VFDFILTLDCQEGGWICQPAGSRWEEKVGLIHFAVLINREKAFESLAQTVDTDLPTAESMFSDNSLMGSYLPRPLSHVQTTPLMK